jgi:hypothetical protein
MAEDVQAQKATLMLWLMLTTNSDIFKGVAAGGNPAPVENALADITGLDDDTKSDMIAQVVNADNFDTFAGVRDLFQSFVTSAELWPPAAGKHPGVAELQGTFFK